MRYIAEQVFILRRVLFVSTSPSACTTLESIPMYPDRIKALVWLLKKEKSKRSDLDLTGQSNLCKTLGTEGLGWIFRRTCLKDVKILTLNNCKLDFIPGLQHFTCLKKLDISNNSLTSIETLKHNVLEILMIQDNPIETVTIHPDNFPKLKLLFFGSSCTKFVCGHLLDKFSKGNLHLEIDPRYVENLIVPFPDVFSSNASDRSTSFGLSRFSYPMGSLPLTTNTRSLVRGDTSHSRSVLGTSRLQSVNTTDKDMYKIMSRKPTFSKSLTSTNIFRVSDPIPPNRRKVRAISRYLQAVKVRLSLGNVSNVEDRYKAYTLIVKEINIEKDVYEFSLSDQAEFCQWLGQEKLNDFLRQPGLHNLHSLYLSNCEIDFLPELHHIKSLRVLDVSHNPIRNILHKLISNPTIETLNIKETKVEAIHFDLKVMKSLNQLQVGSPSLKIISKEILGQMRVGKIKIDVEDHGDCLIYPKLQVFDDLQLLDDFLENTEMKITPDEVQDPEQRYEIMRWQLQEGYTESLDLSSQPDLFEVIIQRGGVESLFTVFNMRRLHTLNLAHTGIKEVPNLNSFTLLQNLDLSHNQIKDTVSVAHKSIQKMALHNNPIPCLNFEPDNLPEIRSVSFGSLTSRFISFPILEQVCIKQINLSVVEGFQENMLLPSNSVLNNSDELAAYVQSVGIDLSYIHDKTDRYSSLLWLLKNKRLKL